MLSNKGTNKEARLIIHTSQVSDFWRCTLGLRAVWRRAWNTDGMLLWTASPGLKVCHGRARFFSAPGRVLWHLARAALTVHYSLTTQIVHAPQTRWRHIMLLVLAAVQLAEVTLVCIVSFIPFLLAFRLFACFAFLLLLITCKAVSRWSVPWRALVRVYGSRTVGNALDSVAGSTLLGAVLLRGFFPWS